MTAPDGSSPKSPRSAARSCASIAGRPPWFVRDGLGVVVPARGDVPAALAQARVDAVAGVAGRRERSARWSLDRLPGLADAWYAEALGRAGRGEADGWRAETLGRARRRGDADTGDRGHERATVTTTGDGRA